MTGVGGGRDRGFYISCHLTPSGLSQLCSETFEQLSALGATFCVSSNPFKSFAFLSNFGAKHWFKAQTKHEKVNGFMDNFNLCAFLEFLSSYFKSEHNLLFDNVWQDIKLVPLDMRVILKISLIFANNFLKLSFQPFFSTDVNKFCEERKIKLLIGLHTKISRHLANNF